MVSYSMFLFPNLIRSFNKCFLQIKKKNPNLLIITCVYVCVCAWVYMPESPHQNLIWMTSRVYRVSIRVRRLFSSVADFLKYDFISQSEKAGGFLA